jgi:hypothetical protein
MTEPQRRLPMNRYHDDSPFTKLGAAVLIGVLLAVVLFVCWTVGVLR